MKKLAKLLNLEGKTAVVTGGMGHLGRAMTEALLELGANVVISGREQKRGKKGEEIISLSELFPKQKLKFAVLDFRKEESVENFFDEVYKQFGALDILVNNAMHCVSKPVEKMNLSEFNDGVTGTLSSIFQCCKHVFPLMKENNRGGSIVNIASMYGMVAPDWKIYAEIPAQNQPANYGAAKAGVIQLTRYLASCWARYGIRVNAVSPGPFPKPEVAQNTAFLQSLKEKTMLNRIGTPEDLKGVIALLASNASAYITGQNFVVDGGWTAW